MIDRLVLRAAAALLISTPLLLAQPPFTVSTLAGGAPPSTPVGALNASFGVPRRVATDAAGNLWFSAGNSIYKIDASGNLVRMAGNSRAGYSGDGGLALAAQLNQPQGIAFDKAGDVYIADTGNHVVRIVTPDGNIATFAGIGSPGYTGDGGAAISCQLYAPSGLAVDSAGNVYIADPAAFAVREVTTDGNITSIAGNGIRGFAGDGGSGVGSQLSEAEDLAIDSSGNLYIADADNNSIRKVDSKGNISTIAGNQTAGISGDKAAATGAQLNGPVGVAIDSQGNLYIADALNGRIRRVDPKGVITTIAGNGNFGFAGDGGQATLANISYPLGLATDSSGNLYIADVWNLRIRKVTSSGTMSTVAGNGILNYSGDGGPATGAQLSQPAGVAIDGARNLYIADTQNNRVRKVAPDGSITTAAGNGQAGFGGDGGQGGAAQLYRPYGLAADAAGNVYIADTLNSRVRKLAPDGTITTVAGNGNIGYSGDGAAATAAQLNLPVGVAVDKSGNLYIADTGNHRVRKVATDGSITTIAGTGVPGYNGDQQPAATAQLFYPNGVWVDSRGDIFIADTQNNRVRLVTTDGVIRPLAGNGYPGYYGDGGDANQAAVVAPGSVAADAAGNVYIASQNGGSIRMVGIDGTIQTIAGGTSVGYQGDGGPASSALFNSVQAMTVDAAGNIYAADTKNDAVRLLAPVPAQ